MTRSLANLSEVGHIYGKYTTHMCWDGSREIANTYATTTENKTFLIKPYILALLYAELTHFLRILGVLTWAMP